MARPTFYFDLRSPDCWLAAERVGGGPVWQPVLLDGLGGPAPWWEGNGRAARMARIEEEALAQGLPAPRWPEGWPNDIDLAMRAAIFAQQSGRVVAFSLAAFRQQFAAGRDLSVPDNVLIAAAACELHPRAVMKGVETAGVRDALERATREAAEVGIRELPATRPQVPVTRPEVPGT